MKKKILTIWFITCLIAVIMQTNEISKLKNENKTLQDELKLALHSITEVESLETHQDILSLACEKYNVPYELAYAIARLETDNFKSDVFMEMNNLGGMCYNEGEYIYFENLADGTEQFVKMLRVYYLDNGLDTPKKMQEKYCPNNDEWAKRVEELMKEY